MSRNDPPFKILIHSLKQLVFYNYDILDDYFNTSFRLSLEANDKIKVIELDSIEPNHANNWFDIHKSDFLELVNFESKTLIAGILILHSEVENILNFICISAKLEKGKTRTLNEINGEGKIEKCKKYLEEEFNIDFSSFQKSWDKLSAFNRLRNILTHQGGKISIEPNKKFEQYGDVIKLSAIQNIKIDSEGVVYILSKEVVFDFLKLSQQLLYDCCELLDNS